MTTDDSQGNENCPPDSASTDEKLNYLLDVVEDQQETIREQQERIEDLQATVEQLQADNDADGLDGDQEDEQEDRKTFRDEVEELTHRVDALAGGMKEANDRLLRLENGANPTHDEGPSLEPETPLEDMVTAPERVLDNENPKRARFVAKDIRQYSHSVPAGRAIKAGELRRILSARDGGRTHTETVDRVITLLDEMGKDEVEIGTTSGSDERVIVFSEECVARIERLQTDHTVVSGDRGGTDAAV